MAGPSGESEAAYVGWLGYAVVSLTNRPDASASHHGGSDGHQGTKGNRMRKPAENS